MNYRKSFYAPTVEAALSMARREFGDEAMLIDSRASRPEQRHLGACEVIVEAESLPAGASIAGSQPLAAPADRRAETSDWSELLKEADRLREELRRVSDLLYQSSGMGDLLKANPAFREVAVLFAAAELPAGCAFEILQSAAARWGDATAALTAPAALAVRLAQEELAARFDHGQSSAAGGERNVIAAIGPAGSGKTTTLVKVAARCGVARHRPTVLISADTCRVGGADQLASYAAILGVPFVAVDTPGALVRAMEEHARKSLVLIDTPGFAPADAELAGDWARLLATHPQVETHLVLPATNRSAALRKAMQNWAVFRPAKLIITRLDETASFGPVLGAAIEAERPVSFTSTGQNVPEDLDEPGPERLAQLLLPAAPMMRAAA